MNELSIMIAGVGGQGTLLASRLIGNAAIHSGADVKLSEVHGMSQRGGSVLTYVKISKDSVYSPVITEGCADIVLAFELLEAYRTVEFLKKDGLLISNTQKINPMPVITGQCIYPEDIEKKISELGIKSVMIDALGLAESAGNQKALNVVLIGVLAKHLSFFPKDAWVKSLHFTVPSKLLEINLKAFEAGYGR